MGDVIDLNPLNPMLHVWAVKFVDLYESRGKEQAADYIKEHVPQHRWDELQGPVKAEFEQRGWTFDD